MGTKALYCTADAVGGGTGGGQVTEHEIAALRRIFDEVTIFSRDSLTPAAYRGVDVPFLQDYFALVQIADEDFEYVHAYSGTFTETVRHFVRKGTLVGYTCPAHDLDLSIPAFKKAYGNYPYPHLADPELWQRFSGGLRAASMVIVPSTHSANFLQRQGVKEDRIQRVPHGFVPELTNIPTQFFDRCVFGYLGQAGPDKGLDLLLEAFEHYRKESPVGAKLILAGRGTEGLEPMVQRLVGEGEVSLLGYVERKQDFWAAIDVYIQPSLTEAFGIEILEAMHAGKPVIATTGAGASDILLEHPGAGMVVDDRDPEMLSSRMCVLAQSLDLRQRLGSKGREVAQEYTWEKVGALFESCVRELCGQ